MSGLVRAWCGANALVFALLLAWTLGAYLANPPATPVVEVPTSFAPSRLAPVRNEAATDEWDGEEAIAVDFSGTGGGDVLRSRAVEAAQAGEIGLAVEITRQALRERPDDPELHTDLGTYRLKQEDHGAAVASFETAIRLAPHHARALFNLGTAHLKQGRLEDALAFLARALDENAWYGEARYNRALALTRLGHVDRAIEEYRVIVGSERGSTAVAAHYNLGLLLARSGAPREALSAFTEALRLAPDHLKARYNKALLLSRMAEESEAMEQYQRLLALAPTHARALVNAGALQMREGRWEEAAVLLRRAIAADPARASAHYNLGLCSAKLGDDVRAVGAFENALRHDSGFAEARYNLALALRRLGRLEEAILQFQRAADLSPEQRDYHYNLGLALAEGGRSEAAIQAYRAALHVDRDYFRARYNLALVHYRRGDFEAAARVFARARQSRPESFEATYNLGLTLLKLERPAEAEEALRAAAALEPALEAHYNLGLALSRQGRLDDAAEEFRAALRLDPKHARSLERIAETYIALHRHDDALQRLNLLQRLDPSDPTAFNTGLALRHRQESEIAQRYFEVAVKGSGEIRRRSLTMLGLVLAESDPQAAERAMHESIAIGDSIEARYNLGVLLDMGGRSEEAVAQFARALELDPDHAPSLKRLGKAHAALGRNERALELLARLQRSNPAEPTAYNTGVALYRDERFGQAVRYFDVAAAGNRDLRSRSLNMRGLALAKQGLLDAALESYREAEREFPENEKLRRNRAWVEQRLGAGMPPDA